MALEYGQSKYKKYIAEWLRSWAQITGYKFWVLSLFKLAYSKLCKNISFKNSLKVYQGLFKTFAGSNFRTQLAPWVSEKIFSLEMVKNNFCLGGTSKQNYLF